MPSQEITVPLIKGKTVDGKGVDYVDALPVNYIAVVDEARGAKGYMLSHPGLTLFATGSGVDRGGFWNERLKLHYRVSGTDLITIDTAGVVTVVGTIHGTGQVSMSHSFNNQSIVADGRWYLHDGTTFQEIRDPDLGVPLSHCWIDSYFFFSDGEYLYHSSIVDETQIDALQFATSEYSPDPSLAVAKTSDNQVIVFNRYTTEYFINKANPDFAFSRIGGKAVKCGCVGSHAWAELGGMFLVMGSARNESITINQISVGQYQSIATRTVDRCIAKYTESELSKVVFEVRTQDRDRLLIVRLPNETLTFNATVAKVSGAANAWAVVKTGVIENNPWRGINGTFVPDVGWVYGDRLGPNIGTLDTSVATQYGDAVESLLYTPLIQAGDRTVHELEIDILPGHQVSVDNLTAEVTTTYDGIKWEQPIWRLYGEDLRTTQRFIAYRLGDVRNFVGFRIRTVAPERFAFSRLVLTVG